MKLNFQQQLDEELLRSERKRTIILISIFLFAIVFRIIDQFLIKPDEETRKIQSFSTVWFFPLGIVLFELLSLFYINKRIKTSRKKIPLVLQYFNTGFEISLPSLIMLVVAKHFPTYDVFKSPALYIYFIFIILSTMRLNFWLSFFCGLVASVSFALLSIFVYHHFNSNDSARSLIILLSGVAAGLVAKQIKAGINNSLREAEKQQRVVSLFGKQVSKEVAEKMLENDGKIESRRMNVAVMFIDIRNFTNYVADKKPEEIVQYQNSFFSIIVDAVEKHFGIVNQFMGDGCMVTFGAPQSLDNPSRHAVDAANDILQQLAINIDNNIISPTKIGIGIHTGEAVTGNIGTIHRQQYSITGNVVILAARIEQLNKKLQSQILVSEDVYNNLNYSNNMAELHGAVALKGYENPVLIYKLA